MQRGAECGGPTCGMATEALVNFPSGIEPSFFERMVEAATTTPALLPMRGGERFRE